MQNYSDWVSKRLGLHSNNNQINSSIENKPNATNPHQDAEFKRSKAELDAVLSPSSPATAGNKVSYSSQ